ncbi:hypothetical protein GH714_027506 [Hevea brasiliensis]|uniref:MATH domain-containing protein n=1 Tax=Hevea brasiliensis TaxID=3981 RepID=A0A6A6N6G6_HEVBR|nr:hypothetical protein GH714_027506 [Hevea brasiliensis]
MSGSRWFINKSSSSSWGSSDFMPLNDIYNASKRFLVKDTLIVEAKISLLADVERILRDNDLEKYESDDFEAGGYKWKMVLYPHGNWNRGANGHISLYLAIAEAKAIPPGSQVDVTLKFFVYDHIRDKYLTIQDDEMRRYHYLKTENGFDQLISLKMFNDPSNGYLFDDHCVFGTEVHVNKYEGKGEKFSIIEEPDNGTFTWKIERFSKLQKGRNFSKEFSVAKHKWRLMLCPKEIQWQEAIVYHLLQLLNNSAHPQLRVVVSKQTSDTSFSIPMTGSDWFISKSSVDCCWGRSDFMPLNDIYDASKGFLVDDTLIVEAQISLLADVEPLS